MYFYCVSKSLLNVLLRTAKLQSNNVIEKTMVTIFKIYIKCIISVY